MALMGTGETERGILCKGRKGGEFAKKGRKLDRESARSSRRVFEVFLSRINKNTTSRRFT